MLSHAEQALHLYRVTGNRAGQAGALNNVGYAWALLGGYQRARVICRQALSLVRSAAGAPGLAAGAGNPA